MYTQINLWQSKVAIHADKIMEIKITWTTDDIWDVAEEHDITLSEAQADAILGRLGDGHDPILGINYGVILDYIEDHIS